ncbi:hypothetical protein LOK74_07370 [Brevibacillus humidisoli]|uniref:hypothetical protein n=1 Tax=Brevibacillus humidisoli TaxID=2895522 RepID=UPI001E626FCD|nr:hypothetical protein [Brevibacillus humidisoli]UFJ42300.1 hypothetical protein LOK74_07370 [Brevibacillus humidisoli]
MTPIVTLTLPNTLEHQHLCREIRDYHKRHERPLSISFDEAMSQIRLQADCIYLPDKRVLKREAVIDGIVKKRTAHYEILPRSKGKTINLHLDSELAAELEQIRNHVSSKTQHEVILDLFVRGLRSFQEEKLTQQAADKADEKQG